MPGKRARSRATRTPSVDAVVDDLGNGEVRHVPTASDRVSSASDG